jgi:MFS family permease
MSGSADVLKDRDVALVWSSSVVSAVGTGAMFVALPYYAYVTTGSVLATALVTLAEYAPTVGIAQLAGVLADRWDPRRVAGCTTAYLLHHDWWWLALVAFGRSGVAQFVPPAAHTVIPAVAPPGRLTEVNAWMAIGSNVARLVGPALGGVLIGVGGLPAAVIADAATFVLAAGLIAAVRPAEPVRRSPPEPVLRSWQHGVAAVRRHPVLRPLIMVMVTVGLGEGFVSALLAPWMRDVAGGGSTELGLMLSLQALGGLLGGIIVIRWSDRWSPLDLLAAGAIGSGVFLLVIINYPVPAPVGPWPAVVLTAFAGVPFSVYGTAQAIAVQSQSGDGLRGRVVGLTFGIQGIAQLVGIAVAGPAALLLGPLVINVDTAAYLVAGFVTIQTVRRLHRR